MQEPREQRPPQRSRSATVRLPQLRLSTRATNLSLLLLVAAQVLTGLTSFLIGVPSGRWIFWLHSSGGLALALLLIWKRRIILRSLRHHGLGLWALPSLVLLTLLLASLLSGVLWSTVGLPGVAGISALTLHVCLSMLLAALLVSHARAGWPKRLTRRELIGRRALLRDGLLLVGGFALWRGTELVSGAARFSGASRRFTGSRPAAQFSGNDFPANSWLFDNPEPLEPDRWRLHVHGAVRVPRMLMLSELSDANGVTATIDCTGGWYSTQRWKGALLSDLLTLAGATPAARSFIVRSTTGYWRRFPISASRAMLLATTVGGETLAHEHGAPLRLVAPGRRGFEWVKWVTEIEVSERSPYWNWPLPIR